MAIFKNRLPSSQQAIYTFAVCIFPTHVWLIINVLREVPAWILRLNIWDTIGTTAYSLMFALIEATLLFLAILIVGSILPASWFRQRIVAVSGVVVSLMSIWFIFLHYNTQIIEQRQLLPFVLWGGSLALLLVAAIIFVNRSVKIEAAIDAFVQRLAVLSFIYLIIDAISVIIVVFRNL